MKYYRLQGVFTLRSPMSHIGESHSTQSFLITEPIIQECGEIEDVPVYNGNAWRGQLRDAGTEYMLDKLGTDSNPLRVPMDIFHLFFTGGRIGGDQKIDIAQARNIRKVVPLLSVFGGGVGNQIMEGKLRVSNGYPIVNEAIPVLPELWHNQARKIPVAAITFDKSFSRMDDSKKESMQKYMPCLEQGLLESEKRKTKTGNDVADQMRMTSELWVPGTQIYQEIDILNASEVEMGALVSAMHWWSQSPHIGGQANKGHGKVNLAYRITEMHGDREESKDFMRVASGGPCLLAQSAENAKSAYDQHLRSVYDDMIAQDGNTMRKLIGEV